MPIPQTHHGMSVADLATTRAVLRSIGFSGTQPGAPEPLVFCDVEGDDVGQQTAACLGPRYETHFVENPVTGQQIDLIQIEPSALLPRPSDGPAQGDLLIGLAVDDPDRALAAMASVDPEAPYRVVGGTADGPRIAWREGQHVVLTTGPPFAVVHYHPTGWPAAHRFLTEVLEVTVDEVVAGERYRLLGIGGRMDIVVDDRVVVPPAGAGKRYPGADHFRIPGVDMDGVMARLGDVEGCGILLPPLGGFAFLIGPSNETVEVFDHAVVAAA